MKEILIIKGNFVYTATPERFEVHRKSYLVSINGKVEGIYSHLPENYSGCKLHNYGDSVIIPGFVDLHLHASQYLQCGMGMTEKLLTWLNDYTFGLEKEFTSKEFAHAAYSQFVDKLVACGTLRSCIYATTSTQGTEELFEILKKRGVGAYVGKINMDQNGPDGLIESTEASLRETEYLIEKYGQERLVKPILTPRFGPTSSWELLEGLGELALRHGLPVQSHLSENKEEVQWVLELFTGVKSYSELYHTHNLLGQTKTLMAHAIHLTEAEQELIRQEEVTLVHCPDSNLNLRSGIMPARHYLNQGIKVGLGSDIAGGHKMNLNEAMVRAIQLSKLVNLSSEGLHPLSVSEVFHMATKRGGEYFGKVGSFEKGYSFDALVLKNEPMIGANYSVEDRLEKFIYTGDDRNIIERYVEGKHLE